MQWSIRRLCQVVRSGEPVSREDDPPEAFGDFIRAMEDLKRGQPIGELIPVDLTGVRRAVDLGGGPGSA